MKKKDSPKPIPDHLCYKKTHNKRSIPGKNKNKKVRNMSLKVDGSNVSITHYPKTGEVRLQSRKAYIDTYPSLDQVPSNVDDPTGVFKLVLLFKEQLKKLIAKFPNVVVTFYFEAMNNKLKRVPYHKSTIKHKTAYDYFKWMPIDFRGLAILIGDDNEVRYEIRHPRPYFIECGFKVPELVIPKDGNFTMEFTDAEYIDSLLKPYTFNELAKFKCEIPNPLADDPIFSSGCHEGVVGIIDVDEECEGAILVADGIGMPQSYIIRVKFKYPAFDSTVATKPEHNKTIPDLSMHDTFMAKYLTDLGKNIDDKKQISSMADILAKKYNTENANTLTPEEAKKSYGKFCQVLKERFFSDKTKN